MSMYVPNTVHRENFATFIFAFFIIWSEGEFKTGREESHNCMTKLESKQIQDGVN